ncbi:MAG: hypothetical protein ACKVS8_05555 [Phycisphaerales bacterium]
MALVIEADDSLAADQRGVFKRLAAVLAGPQADHRYNRLREADGGRIVSVDVARLLAPEFVPWDGRLRHTPSTANPAGAYAHDRLLRELASRRQHQGRLLITAGGAGSGKTSSLRGQGRIVDLIFDNQFKNLHRAREVLHAAISHRWEVRVVYVHRPFRDVVRAVIERSQRTGRWNALAGLGSAHRQAQATIVQLRSEFGKAVVFTAQYNATRGVPGPARGSRVLFRDLHRGGRYHLTDAEASLEVVAKELHHAREEGVVCAEIARLIGQGLPQYAAARHRGR